MSLLSTSAIKKHLTVTKGSSLQQRHNSLLFAFDYLLQRFISFLTVIKVGLLPSKKIVLFASMKALWKWWKKHFISS